MCIVRILNGKAPLKEKCQAPTIGSRQLAMEVNHVSFLHSYSSMENGRECSMPISCLSEVVGNRLVW